MSTGHVSGRNRLDKVIRQSKFNPRFPIDDDGERGFPIDDMYTSDATGYTDVMTTSDVFDRDSREPLDPMVTDRTRRPME